jgi:hypothetical protein
MADKLREIREAIGTQGVPSTMSCGCEQRRVERFAIWGVTVSGDVIVRQCAYHEWYGEQPPEVQRQVSRQERARDRGEENRA